MKNALDVIAKDFAINRENIKIENGAVFYDSQDGMRCACQIGTEYWFECCARAIIREIMDK